MAGDEAGSAAPRSGGVLHSLRRLASTLIELVHTRLDLLATEFEEERLRLQQMVVLAAVAAFCGAIGLVLLSMLIVVAFWDSHRVLALGLLTAAYFAAAAAAFIGYGRKAAAKPGLFSATLAELEKDRQWLKSR